MKQRSLARNRLRRLSWLRFVLQLATVAGVYLGVSVAVPFAFLVASGGDAQNFVMTNPMLLSSAVLSMLAALIVAAGTGYDTTPAALTLWREFHAARADILTIAEPDRLAA